MSVPTPIVVLHDIGDPAAGAGWRAALDVAWEGLVVAPDLPGHGSAPAPVGGTYEAGDALLVVVPLLNDLPAGLPAPVVVGVGVHGWAAQVLALAGRAGTLVLVDGLNGPWRTPAEQIAEGRRWLRGIAEDDAALAPPPARGLDPRTRHSVPAQGSRRLALKAAAAMPVPVLVLESPASALTEEEVDEVAAEFASGATVERIASAAPRHVVPVLASRSSTGDLREELVGVEAPGAST